MKIQTRREIVEEFRRIHCQNANHDTIGQDCIELYCSSDRLVEVDDLIMMDREEFAKWRDELSQSNPKNDATPRDKKSELSLATDVLGNDKLSSPNSKTGKLRKTRNNGQDTLNDNRPTPILKGESAKRFRQLTGL